jgi:metal-responsive CopG/Arc/MetJ family transcriptional regulator
LRTGVYSPPMKRTNLYLDEKLLAKFQRLADEHGSSISHHVRKAMEEYIARIAKQKGKK